MLTSLLSLCAGMALMAGPQTPAAPAAQPATESAGQVHTVNRPIIAPVSFAYFPVETEVVAQTNAERARHGLPALTLDPSLVTTSRKHTWWMTRNHSLQHGHYNVAENIAMGQNSSHEVVRAWMNSSGHRANILNRGHRRIGVAAYTSSSGAIYWTQQFAP